MQFRNIKTVPQMQCDQVTFDFALRAKMLHTNAVGVVLNTLGTRLNL